MVIQIASTFFNEIDESFNDYGYVIGAQNIDSEGKVAEPGIITDHYACFFRTDDLSHLMDSGVLENNQPFVKHEVWGKTRKTLRPYDFNGPNSVSNGLDNLRTNYTALVASRSEHEVMLFYSTIKFSGEQRAVHHREMHCVAKPQDYAFRNFENKIRAKGPGVGHASKFLTVSPRKRTSLKAAAEMINDFFTDPKLLTAISGTRASKPTAHSLYVVGNLRCGKINL